MASNVKKRKIATNIPATLINEATKISGLNQTAAIIEGLKELIRREKTQKLIAHEGTFSFDYNPLEMRRK